MKTKYLLFTLPLVLLAISACNCDEESNPKQEIITETQIINVAPDITAPTISKGVYGFVTEWKGDFMPNTANPGNIDSVPLDIYVYAKLGFNDVKMARTGATFWSLSQMPVKPLFIIKTNNRGFSEADLPKGDYSFFILLDNDRLFCNRSSGREGNLFPFTVDGSSLKKLDFIINYEAHF